MYRFLLLVVVYVLASCKTTTESQSQLYNDSIHVVSLCDLPKFKGQQVYLKAYYSGVDEYWSLTALEKKKCVPELKVDLQFAESPPFFDSPPEKYRSVFDEVHNNYHNSYLFLEAIGTFENEEKSGYGHLGYNNSRFLVSRLISAKVIRAR